jgi:hypothetical protein
MFLVCRFFRLLEGKEWKMGAESTFFAAVVVISLLMYYYQP